MTKYFIGDSQFFIIVNGITKSWQIVGKIINFQKKQKQIALFATQRFLGCYTRNMKP